MKKIYKKLFIILIFLVIIIALILIRSVSFKKNTAHYITVTVGKRDIEEKILASGTLNAFKIVDVGAQVSGQLKKLHVVLGDYVKKGQLLAEIDPTLQQNSLKKAEAQVESLQAQKNSKQAMLKQYDASYKRQLKMIHNNATSYSDLERAQALFDSTVAEIAFLDAKIKQAKIEVITAETNLDYTKIIAPISGTVVHITTQEGQTLISTQAATNILKLADFDIITVKVGISEADIMRIVTGQKVYFTTLGDPDKKYYSTLRDIEPYPELNSSSSLNANTAIYYNGLFEVPNYNHALRVLMTVQVAIILQEIKQALCIPINFLGNSGESEHYTVKVLIDNIPEIRKIKTGITDGYYIQILSGLQEGEQIILE